MLIKGGPVQIEVPRDRAGTFEAVRRAADRPIDRGEAPRT
ncbi:hypothetical protein ACFFGD_04800 [Cellulomonas uda]|nr:MULTISPECIES: hypothetical protein [Cellulomonas]